MGKTFIVAIWYMLNYTQIDADFLSVLCQINEVVGLLRHVHTVDLENFGVKNFCIAHTSTKLKHTRFFYYENFTFK